MAARENRFDKQDVKILALATGAVILAGVVWRRSSSSAPAARARRRTPGRSPPAWPRRCGADLKDGGPYFFPDPFGGDKNMMLALEDGKIVALATLLPNSKTCQVKWKDSQKAFVDCHGDKLKSTELARYPASVGKNGNFKGILLIDPRELLPPPNPT